MKYQIIESKYHNEFGKEATRVYTIKYRKTFLGIPYWKTVKHWDCSWGDCYKRPTEFGTHSLAHEFILNVLCENECKDGWSSKVVSEFDCSMDKNNSDTNKNNIS